jgi:hypothetical protein
MPLSKQHVPAKGTSPIRRVAVEMQQTRISIVRNCASMRRKTWSTEAAIGFSDDWGYFFLGSALGKPFFLSALDFMPFFSFF